MNNKWKRLEIRPGKGIGMLCYRGCISPSSRLLLTATGYCVYQRPSDLDEYGLARLWNPLTGKPASPWIKHQGGVNAVAFSPDEKDFLQQAVIVV